jgi:hypothetical protein
VEPEIMTNRGEWKTMKWKLWVAMCGVLCLLYLPAAEAKQAKVPEELKPWVDWVLHGQDSQYRGIPLYNNNGTKRCAWPGELSLSVDGEGGVFTQFWHVNCESWVTLPGSDPFWPLDVRLNGQPAISVKRNGLPAVKLDAGDHRITGRLPWKSLPEHLSIPKDTGLIRLTINGAAVDFPRLDEQGRLWFQVERQAGEIVENRLTIQSYRSITDSIPPVMTVFLKLDVSGTAREMVLGPVFSARSFVPLSLTSSLPARVDPDGRLVVQVRPGQWFIELTARRLEPLASLIFDHPGDGYWPDESIWVFEAQPNLRTVEVTGVPAIDPQQTTLPEKWRHLPAYRMTPDDTMTFTELKRGDPDPAPDQLTLNRQIWLRFDGSGYTIRDAISGRKNSDWRMEMNPPMELGKVEVDGSIQFITRREGTRKTGVEVRNGPVNLIAESEYSGSLFRLPLTGWDQHFQGITATLALPPGYRLIHAFGFDSVPNTWIARWNLLDLFFVLLVTAASSRLLSKKVAILTFITLGLLYHEKGAPRWIWLAVLIGLAFLKYLPECRFRNLMRVYQGCAILILAIISLSFAVRHLREGIYPQLELDPMWTTFDQTHYASQAPASRVTGYAEEALEQVMDGSSVYRSPYVSKKSQVAQYDPRMVTQTGPGLPEWRWRTITMTSGPVEADQSLTLLLIGPKITTALNFIRVLLMVALAAGFLGITYRRSSGWNGTELRKLFTGAAVLIVLALAIPTQCAEFPSPQLLGELRTRLLEADDCFPNCADVSDMSIRITPDHLTVSMMVNSRIDTAIPLPGNQKHWLPQEIFLNRGKQAAMFRSGGVFWAFIPEGRHHLELKGLLPAYNIIQLPLPMKPGSVNVQADGWSVEGIRDTGFIDNQIQFQRLASGERKPVDMLETGVMPPFVQVERTLLLGIDWRVVTRVQRLTPLDSAIVLELPLIPGESVVTEGIDVKEGTAWVNLDASTGMIEWESILEPSDKIVLTHADTMLWTEEWEVDISPILHMEYDGIPVIMQQQDDRWFPRWHPWPGEEVRLSISRPEGVDGQTLTIQKSVLNVKPGKRVTECSLSLTLQSSQGLQHIIQLPEGAEVQQIQINGRNQPIRREGRGVPVSITPGMQEIRIMWRENRGMSLNYRTPQIDLGTRNVNANIEMVFPPNRWPLWVYGPRLGPAVLFWPLLIAILLGSLILGKSGITPLKYRHWFILAIGMTQGEVPFIYIVAIWLIILHFRGKLRHDLNRRLFDLLQLGIIFLTGIAMVSLIIAVSQGLLGRPDMSITGNGSYAGLLKWYQDSSGPEYPAAGVISIHVLFYRLAMLLWALWTAFYMVDIMKWAWTCFSRPVYWRPFWTKKDLT